MRRLQAVARSTTTNSRGAPKHQASKHHAACVARPCAARPVAASCARPAAARSDFVQVRYPTRPRPPRPRRCRRLRPGPRPASAKVACGKRSGDHSSPSPLAHTTDSRHSGHLELAKKNTDAQRTRHPDVSAPLTKARAACVRLTLRRPHVWLSRGCRVVRDGKRNRPR